MGRIDEFANAVRKIPGLDWLLDIDIDDIPPDDNFRRVTGTDLPLSGRVYLVMANQEGIHQLVRLWRRFRDAPEDSQWARGLARWRDLFRLLRDVHPWGPEDRIRETGLEADWERHVAADAHTASIELELWFRSAAADRERADQEVRAAVAGAGGTVVGQTILSEIAYHAVAAELPVVEVGRMLGRIEGTSRLVRSHHVVYIRPTGQSVRPPLESDLVATEPQTDRPLPEGDPIAAVLDGLPVERHALLDGRLIVDDPDGWAAAYTPNLRAHGTAMASLVALGDLSDAQEPLRTPVYVRPILRPEDRAGEVRERLPKGILAADVIHRAVVRILGSTEAPGVAPSVRVINHSLGDALRPFDQEIGPWARVLDHLAWSYRVLFVVSAGNQTGEIVLDLHRGELAGMTPVELQRAVVRALTADTRHRRLLEPAEAIQVLTVGALHVDHRDGQLPAGHVNPYFETLPSPVSAHGGGFHRSVKPDVLMAGGRQVYRVKLGNTHTSETLELSPWAQTHGQEAAAPPRVAGQLNATSLQRGTSNSAALVTRLAAQTVEALRLLRDEPGGDRLTEDFEALSARVLIVHGASWDELQAPLVSADREGFLQRLSGYGAIRPRRVGVASDERGTMIAWGLISDGEANRFAIPLPESLSGLREWRRVTVTLGWLTPILPTHRSYRRAALWFDPYGADKTVDSFIKKLGVRRVWGEYLAPRRGTLQHETFEGSSATAYPIGSEAGIQVNCRTDAGTPVLLIPYALAISIEVAPELGLPIYDEIRARIRPVVPVGVR